MEKPWRLHLANSAIQFLDIISGDPSIVAVWTRDGHVSFYDLERGSSHGTAEYTLPESPEQWPVLLASLKDPKGRSLPFARIGGLSLWPLVDGQSISYYGRSKISLDPGKGVPPLEITFDVQPSALAVDPVTQLVAALDSTGALLLGRPGGTIKTLRPGLAPVDDLPLSVAVSRSGKRIVVCDGNRLIIIDSGKVSARRDLHYACGPIAMAPDGERILTFDSDSGVLRAYVTDALRLTHQRFVVDLLSSAGELQLMGFAELPPVSAALNALAFSDTGDFVFAVSGQVCAASLNHLSSTDVVPSGGKTLPPPKSEPSVISTKPAEKQTSSPSVSSGEPPKSPTSKARKPAYPTKDTSPLIDLPKGRGSL